MPDTIPSFKTLLNMGVFSNNAQPSPDEQRIYDAIVRKQQEGDPTWKKAGRNVVDVLGGASAGLAGVDPNKEDRFNSPVSYWSNAATQLGQAAYPFAKAGMAVKAGLPLLALTKDQPIYHGTGKVFEHFNPELNDTSDVLGWMTHGTPNTNYAEEYATGSAKHGYGWEDTHRPENIIAMKPQAKNTLDLIDPHPDDISAALAAMEPYQREEAISRFKQVRKGERGEIPGYTRYGYLKGSHYPNAHDLPANEIPLRAVADYLHLEPQQFDKTPFDAIRYRDVGHESYAIKPGTPIQSAYGAPMTPPERPPIQVVKDPFNRPTGATNEMVNPVQNAYGQHVTKFGPNDIYSQPSSGKTLDELFDAVDKHAQANYPNYKKPVSLYESDILKDAKVNAGYTKKQSLDLMDKAEKLGINYHKMGNLQQVEDAIHTKINKGYSAMEKSDLLDQADELGIDTNNMKNYEQIQDAILSHPSNVMKHHPTMGPLTKQDAKDLVNGGEVSMGWYMKNFPD